MMSFNGIMRMGDIEKLYIVFKSDIYFGVSEHKKCLDSYTKGYGKNTVFPLFFTYLDPY